MIPRELRCLYLHGFKSGPASLKAQQMLSVFRQQGAEPQITIPQLANEPAHAQAQMDSLYQGLIEEVGEQHVFLIGSSLGGFYATYLVEKWGGRAVLINPAIRPHELLGDYLGENTHYYSDETFMVTEDYLHQLKALYCETLTDPQRFLLLQQIHDETLDYREAVAKYSASPAIIEYGGDHSYQQFEKRIPTILRFAQSHLATTAARQ